MDVTLVTGGAGFIGSHLVGRLLAGGARVRVLERPGAPADHLPPGVELVRADVRDRAAVRDAVRGCRHVYHLAADPNLWTRDRRDFDAVNRLGTVHVLNEALDAGAERVLHASTESILTSPTFAGPSPPATIACDKSSPATSAMSKRDPLPPPRGLSSSTRWPGAPSASATAAREVTGTARTTWIAPPSR